MKKFALLFALIVVASNSFATGNQEKNNGNHVHDKRPSKNSSVTQTAGASAGASSKAASASLAAAAGGTGGSGGSGGTGGNSSASAAGGSASAGGGNATATGGQVGNITVSTGNGSGLTGRMVPDVSTTSPATSTTCRNGISAGGSGNGWGGLLGFFSEDDACEWRLLEANYRATGDHDKANAIRNGMTAQRCRKLSPEDRDAFGALCPKPQESDKQNFSFSAG